MTTCTSETTHLGYVFGSLTAWDLVSGIKHVEQKLYSLSKKPRFSVLLNLEFFL